MAWVVILEGPDGTAGGTRSDVYEVTPPPERGREREELGRLVRGIHPGAVEVGWDGARAVFDDGGRAVTARFARAGDDGPAGGAPSQGTLFDR
ncbi:MAG: hypothetical protein AB7V62_01720 [Thermoleophilia bacterium]